ncbi:sigma-70 family RNA polymerase sigma factor [Halopseudomonas sp.]|uniref:sigma-70 family RNA polymerase sigma factor n=1 Tax=Halopseudomonas sp. TaxID=2901191 RepID=UPI0030017B21
MASQDLGGLRMELRRFMGKRMNNAADADDLAQDVFVRWLDSTATQPLHQARPLLFRIARNLMVDHWRRQQIRSGTGLVELNEQQAEQDDALQTEGPLAMVEQQQRLHRLAEALEDLPPKRKQAFVLHKFDGLSQAAVARQMGISLSMVEKHIALAMLHCRRHAQSRVSGQGD